jgi:hypothetical protein
MPVLDSSYAGHRGNTILPPESKLRAFAKIQRNHGGGFLKLTSGPGIPGPLYRLNLRRSTLPAESIRPVDDVPLRPFGRLSDVALPCRLPALKIVLRVLRRARKGRRNRNEHRRSQCGKKPLFRGGLLR